MLEAGFGRDCAVVAVGGGVTGDLAGFVAATIHRGVPCVQVPTSLLAMIDSSVGGKTGIDTVHGKNLVGAFHQPSVVIVDGSTLDTLPNRHISAGAAEALKHGAIADAEYFDWIVANSDAILSRDRETLLSLVQRSIAIKAGVVSDDETEQGRRAVLNFGHTVGHALETVMDFSLLHGEAVAIGMLAEADLGIRMGITGACAAASLRTALDALQLPTRPRIGAAAHRLMAAMEKDKKVRHGSVRFTLLERIGQVHQSASGEWTHHVTESVILDALKMLL
jgi:3-dehydroquinate synthase